MLPYQVPPGLSKPNLISLEGLSQLTIAVFYASLFLAVVWLTGIQISTQDFINPLTLCVLCPLVIRECMKKRAGRFCRY